MVNSRQLIDLIATSLDWPVTATTQHARNLREGKSPDLMTYAGRGRHAPAMTLEDAAAVLCAVLGSQAVMDSIETVRSMRRLRGKSQSRSGGRSVPTVSVPPIELDLRPGHDAVEGLAGVLRFFEREDQYLEDVRRHTGRSIEVYAAFEVEYPAHFVSMTIGVRHLSSQTWTYGKRKHTRIEQIRRCREGALREIARGLGREDRGHSSRPGRAD